MPISPSSLPGSASAAFPRQFARTRRFSLGVPRRFAVSPDGRRVLFLRTGGGTDPASGLWLYEDGAERLLAGPASLGGSGGSRLPEEERVRRERTGERSDGVVAYATDREVRLAVFALGGALWAVRTDGGSPFRIRAAGPVVDPRPAPDGRSVAYVTRGALHVVDLDGNDRVLASPEAPDVTYGLAEHVAAESMYRMRGFWWAPDGSALLAARADTSRVQRWYIGDPANPHLPPRAVPYPPAGTPNADVSLRLLPLDGGEPVSVDWDRAAFEYLAAADWDAYGPLLAVQSRDQRTVRVLAADPATGATRPLHEQRDPDWVGLVPGTPCRTASGALVHPYDDEDARRLRIGDDAVSPAGLHLRTVLGTDGERVLFTANEEPTETHVWAYEPDGRWVRLSEGPGVHTAATGGGTVVLDSLTPDGHRTVVRHGSGEERKDGRIPSLAEEPVVRPQPAYLVLGRRELRSALHLPSWHEPGDGPLPVLLDPYGGPAGQLVVRARDWGSAVSQWFAEQGFAVLVTDGRGTPGRSPGWEKTIRGDKIGPALEDQIEALRAAAERCPDLDLGRVAIRGWSYGGYLAAGAVLRRPDVFHAAVAGAAPFDQRLYDTHWQERFLGHPDERPEAYERSSLIGDAPGLSRPLLLVHGLADDNVTAAHTLRMSAALLAAGRPHTVLPLPGVSHRAVREEVAENLLMFERDFLLTALAGERAGTPLRTDH